LKDGITIVFPIKKIIKIIPSLKKKVPPEDLLCSGKPTLIEIHAGWSGESHLMDFIIKEIEEQFRENLNIMKIDFDDYGEWLDQLGIKNPPAFLFIKNGEVIEIICEILPKKNLVRRIYDLLLIP
jgi:hypothetical protein